MRIANFWTQFGPAFYQHVDANDNDNFGAIQWLLGVCAGPLRCSHVNIPTESRSTFANDFSIARLHKVVDAAIAAGLQPIIWADKWHYNAPPTISWFTTLAQEFPTAILNLGQEVDVLWLWHGYRQVDVCRRIGDVYKALLAAGVQRERLMIGGVEPLGGLQLAQFLQMDAGAVPGFTTLTVWKSTERAWPGNWPGGVHDSLRSALAYLTGSLQACGLTTEVVLLEAGWRAIEPNNVSLQGQVLDAQLAAARDVGVQHVGLWAPIDSPDNIYGALDGAGNGRQDVIAAWCR